LYKVNPVILPESSYQEGIQKFFFSSLKVMLVAHAYNPSYLGGRDRRIVVFRAIGQNELGMVYHTYNPSYPGSKGRKIVVQGQLGKSTRPYLKKKP
jgi:hypothetical protein